MAKSYPLQLDVRMHQYDSLFNINPSVFYYVVLLSTAVTGSLSFSKSTLWSLLKEHISPSVCISYFFTYWVDLSWYCKTEIEHMRWKKERLAQFWAFPECSAYVLVTKISTGGPHCSYFNTKISLLTLFAEKQISNKRQVLFNIQQKQKTFDKRVAD